MVYFCDPWVKEVVFRNVGKYFELNENKSTLHRNVWVLRNKPHKRRLEENVKLSVLMLKKKGLGSIKFPP